MMKRIVLWGIPIVSWGTHAKGVEPKLLSASLHLHQSVVSSKKAVFD